MAKQVKQYIKNPKYGQPGEPERILVPQMISENGAFLNRMAQIEKLEYNTTQVTGNNYNGLAEALASVTNDKYKVKGIVLTWFDSAENQWKSMRYNGVDSTGWSEVGNWVETGGASKVSNGDSYNASYFLELAQLGESGTVSQEDYNNLKEAIISNKYIYASLTSVEQNGTMFLPISGLYINDGILQLFIHQGLNIGNFVINPDLSYTFSTISGGAPEHTLDLSPLFDSEGSPVATVTDEFLAEVQKAIDLKYSNVTGGLIGELSVPAIIGKEDGILMIIFNTIVNEGSKKINNKIYQIGIVSNNLIFLKSNYIIDLSGSGTKALTDNGQYAEFASPVKVVSGGSGAVTQQINPNTYYEFGECTSLTITLAAEKPGILNEYMFEFVSGSTPTTLTDIPNIKWQNGDKLVPEANCTYQVSIVNNCAVYAKFTNA